MPLHIPRPSNARLREFNPCNRATDGRFGRLDDPECAGKFAPERARRAPNPLRGRLAGAERALGLYNDDPDVRAAKSGMAEDFRQAGGKSTFDLHRDPADPTLFTEERTALHRRIIQKALDKPGNQLHPTVIFMAGLPAAGKTTATHDLGFSDKVVVNADAIKDAIPEYTGGNAAFVHEESSYIAKQTVRAAIAQRSHVIYDGMMASAQSASLLLQQFVDAGYRVEVRLVDVSLETSLTRAYHRFKRGVAEHQSGNSPHNGRFMPPEVITGAAGGRPGDTNPARNARMVARSAAAWIFYDNNGDVPRVIEKFGTLTEAAAFSVQRRASANSHRRLCSFPS